MGVVGELLKTVLVSRRFAGFAKPNLIRHDDAKTIFLQYLVGRLPSGCAKVFTVQQNSDMTIGFCWLDVQIGHVHITLLRFERKLLHRGRVVKAF